jgi:alkanesulfonate monooxygenase SsuD/methylene tetrahydromethanopterin reductase-like flavin-dependent oxidoreductase (luciferase family)
MRFGLFTGALRTGGTTPYHEVYEDFVAYVVAAEELGFESVFLVEHHFTGLGDIGASLLVLGHLASRTSTMRLGSAVTVLPWHVPPLLAEQAATVDVLSGGRLDFGVGRGYRPNEFHGFCIDEAQARGRFDECLDVVVKAWTSTERFSHDGRHWRFRDIVVEPRPVQRPHPPIWVAALSENSVRDAARQGRFLLLDQFSDAALTAQRITWYREECAALGRPFDPSRVALTRGLLLLDTDDPARRQAEIDRRSAAIAELASSARVPTADGELTSRDHAFFESSSKAVEATAILGGPEECIDRLLELRDAGVDYVLFNDLWGGIDRLRLFAEEVMPALRS